MPRGYRRLLERLYNGPRHESGVYEVLADFVEHRDHKGLYLLKINVDDPDAYMRYLNVLTGKLQIKNEEFLPKYKGKHLSGVDYGDLNHHSVVSDGAIAVNGFGIVMDDHRVVRLSLPEFITPYARSGCGHTAMASVSLFPRVAAYVCSGEKANHVTKFENGRIKKKYPMTVHV